MLEMGSPLRADEEHLKALGFISFFIHFESGFASVIPSVLGAVLEALGNPPSVCYLWTGELCGSWVLGGIEIGLARFVFGHS